MSPSPKATMTNGEPKLQLERRDDGVYLADKLVYPCRSKKASESFMKGIRRGVLRALQDARRGNKKFNCKFLIHKAASFYAVEDSASVLSCEDSREHAAAFVDGYRYGVENSQSLRECH